MHLQHAQKIVTALQCLQLVNKTRSKDSQKQKIY